MKKRAVLYLRLSKEDKDKLNKGDASASIQNQRLLLIEYALEHDFEITAVYSDDDESGLYDTRPEFERMITDGKFGKYDVILAKSQSRFSRNMEHIEKYLHHDFPNLGIRFIGVVDGTDTANIENKKSRQINGLVNEWYCEDLSKNIRSALHAKMKAGKYLGSSCPYGYIKDPQDHNHLIVDEYAAHVVKRIFQLYLQGFGKAKIGKILSDDGILIPSLYKREILRIHYHNSHEKETTKNWSYQTIHTILNNEVYIGNLVQNKYNNLSYKDKKHIRQPEEKWIRVENQHEAIIEKDTFLKVQERQKIRTKAVNTVQSASLFSGILVCADCKHTMVRMYNRRGDHKFIGYCCKTYKTHGKSRCNSHAINNELLEKTVLTSLQKETRQILTLDDLKKLDKIKYIPAARESSELQINYLEKEMKRRENYKRKTYQNYMDGTISKSEYLSYTRGFEEEIAELQKQFKTMTSWKTQQQEADTECDEWTDKFKNYMNLDSLTRNVVLELIDRIEVQDSSSIRIYYKFKNPFFQSF